jgi:hypothetical protein
MEEWIYCLWNRSDVYEKSTRRPSPTRASKITDCGEMVIPANMKIAAWKEQCTGSLSRTPVYV